MENLIHEHRLNTPERYLLRVIAYFLPLMMGIFLLSGCSAFISSATVNLTDNLSKAILNNNDLKTVEDGAPAYLLMIDSLISGDPNNESLLCAGANLYSAYSDVFVKDKVRSDKLTSKALKYALHAVCIRRTNGCTLQSLKFDEFTKIIQGMTINDVAALYTLGISWAEWISAHRDDWNAAADISKVETIMQRVVELDDKWQDGGAYMYLGVMATLLPSALGGKPEIGRKFFEQAIAISGGKNLMMKVVYARQYARLVFDRELHDRLLNEVLKAEIDVQGYTLLNTLAQKEARELLESAESYF